MAYKGYLSDERRKSTKLSCRLANMQRLLARAHAEVLTTKAEAAWNGEEMFRVVLEAAAGTLHDLSVREELPLPLDLLHGIKEIREERDSRNLELPFAKVLPIEEKTP